MKVDLVVERIRLCTNTYIEIRQRWLTADNDLFEILAILGRRLGLFVYSPINTEFL